MKYHTHTLGLSFSPASSSEPPTKLPVASRWRCEPFVCMMQAQHTQALQARLEQLSAEVAAQRLALAAATRERDGARAAAVETSERLGVSLIWQPRSYLALPACCIL